MSYTYLKKPVSAKTKRIRLDQKKRKLLSGLFLAFGITMFLSVLIPILKFQLEYSRKFGQIVNPLATAFYNSSATTDYTQLSNWFVSSADSQKINSLINKSKSSTYKLSIPILKIQDAIVDTNSMDLKKTLIQYPGTALPGTMGNPVIFGHSVLPQFFNPKSYLTIFSNLFKLKNGDEIFVEYDRIKYKYIVEEIFEVKPTDFSVLDQRFDAKYMTLITCSPPGTYLRRLVVKTKIAE